MHANKSTFGLAALTLGLLIPAFAAGRVAAQHSYQDVTILRDTTSFPETTSSNHRNLEVEMNGTDAQTGTYTRTVDSEHARTAGPADELRMHARVIGEGPPLVLVGGGLTGYKSWEPHAERLADRHTVARLQPLNVQFGLENRPLPEGYSLPTESAALKATLDELGWRDPVDLVGWSYGALASLDFALNHPERIRTLTLIEPPAAWVLPDRDSDEGTITSADMQTNGDDIDLEELERLLHVIGLIPSDMSAAEMPQWPVWVEHRRSFKLGSVPLEHTDDPDRLRRLERPVWLVTGTGTDLFYHRVQAMLASQLPQVQTSEMPAGHGPHIVSMDRFLAELDRFIAAAD